MSNCYYCGRRESFDVGQNTPEGWLCSRCRNVGALAVAVAAAPVVHHNSGAHLVGVLGNLVYNSAEINALQRAVNSPQHDTGDEDIWGLGFAARHQTTPGINIVIVFTRVAGAVTVYGIGNHIGKGNGHYRILRWNGSNVRVDR